MKVARRQLLKFASGAAVLQALPDRALAQPYPNRAVRIVVASTPAGTADFLGRLVGQWLSERLGQPFVIENKPGGGTNIGTEAVVNASADGYTLLLIVPASAINATLHPKLSFNFIRDIAPVAGLIRAANVMEVHPSVPAKTVPEFIAYAKANPGKVSYASAGVGTSLHLIGELFNMMAGIKMVHVPYRGTAPALMDLLSGQVQVMFDNIPPSLEHIKSGKLRALAVTTAIRSELLPEVPTVGEFLPGFEASSFFGIGAPRGTPPEIVDKLNLEINALLTDARMKVRLAELGRTLPGPATAFGRLIIEETEIWAKVVRFSGTKLE